jgi:hypothetical protein
MGILSQPLTNKLKHLRKLVIAIAKLHNYCINERLATLERERTLQNLAFRPIVNTPRNVAFTQHEIMLRDTAAYEEFEELQHNYENAWSNNRDRMVKKYKL